MLEVIIKRKENIMSTCGLIMTSKYLNNMGPLMKQVWKRKV